MIDQHEVPQYLRETYHRVILRAPEPLRGDGTFQLMTLLHLKVGGERLASQNTELFKLMLEEERIFNRWLIREADTDEKEATDSDEITVADETSDNEDESDDTEDDLDDDEEPFEDDTP